MSDLRVKQHPRLGILIGTDGHIMMPRQNNSPPRWTIGYARRDGYMAVNIAHKMYLIHRLVAEAFLGSIPPGMEIDHIDRVKSHNCLKNLRFVTHSENCRNRATSDVCKERFGVNFYENPQLYAKRQTCEWRKKNRAHDLERARNYNKEYYHKNQERLKAKSRTYYKSLHNGGTKSCP